jgi:hypothetical protein
MTNNTTEHRERRFRVLRNPHKLARAAIALSVAGGVSGCDVWEKPDTTVVEGGDSSWTDGLFNARHAFDPLRDMVYDSALTEEQIKTLKEKADDYIDVGPVTVAMQKNAANEALKVHVIRTVTSSDPSEPGLSMDSLREQLSAAGDRQPSMDEVVAARIGATLDKIAIGRAEPEEVLPVLSEEGFPISKELEDVATRTDAAWALSNVYNLDSFLDAVDDIGESDDPELNGYIQAMGDVARARSLRDEYSYGGITKEEYSQQAATIKNKALRQLLKKSQEAEDAGDYGAQDDIDSALYDKRDEVDDAIREYREKVTEEIEAQYDTDGILTDAEGRKYAAMDAIDKALDKQMIDGNAQLEPVEMKKFEPLPSSFDTIDFSDVSSDKTIYVLDDDSVTEEYKQFAELRTASDVLELHFESSAKIGQDQKEQLRRAIGDVLPMVEAALDSGELLSVRFVVNPNRYATDYDFDPYFSPRDKTIYMVLPQNDSVSEDMLRGTLTHEVVHALFNSAYIYGEGSEKEIAGMKNACSALSDQARGQFEQSLKYSSESIDNLIATSYGEDKRLFSAIKDLVVKGALNTAIDKSHIEYADNFSWGCESPNFVSMLGDIGRDIEYGPDDGGLEVSELLDRYEDNDDFSNLITAWYSAIELSSLYAQFNESSHTHSTSRVKEYLGHSEDVYSSGTEMPASVLNALLTKTDYMKSLYAGASKAEKKTIRQATSASMAILINRYPNLKVALNDAYATMIKAT